MDLSGKDYVLYRGRRGCVTSPKDLKSDSFHTSEELDDGKEDSGSCTNESLVFGRRSKPLNNQLVVPKTVILHYSPLKSAWDWLILILVLYVAVLTPFMAAFKIYDVSKKNETVVWNNVTSTERPNKSFSTGRFLKSLIEDKFTVIDIIVDFLFFVDMLTNFRTTYLNNGELVVNPKKIAVNYLKGWFIIDFFSAIPFDMIITIAKKSDTVTATNLMKSARLLRLFRVARKMDHYSEYGASLLILLMAFITLLAHWLACAFYLLAEKERLVLEHPIGWLHYLANLTGMQYVPNDVHSGPDIQSKYITSLYFTFTILTTVGFGNIAPVTDLEKIFAIVAMIIGSLANAAIFGNVATIMHRMYRGNKEYHDKSASIKDFIKFHKIPKKLARRLHESNQEDWWQTNGVDMNKVMRGFPEGMQADICLHLNKSLLTKCSVFINTSPGCLRMISLKFKLLHLPPGETLIHQNDLLNGIYFVARGTLEISRDCIVAAILTKNDILGEDAKEIEDKTKNSSCLGYRSKYSVRALSYCDLHKMSLPDLFSIFSMYPEFAADFFRKFVVTFNISTLLESLKEENLEKLRGRKQSKVNHCRPPVTVVPQIASSQSSLMSQSSFAQSLMWDNSDFQTFKKKFQREHLKEIKRRINKLQKQLMQFEECIQKKLASILESLS